MTGICSTSGFSSNKDLLKLICSFSLYRYINYDGNVFPFVKGIFTIFGHGNVLGIGQALEENRGHLEVFQGRNEQGMAHAATGFAKQKNRLQIFACTSSIGPGAANMVTAAATATANRIPLLLLPGDTYSVRQPDPVLQQLEQFDSAAMTTNDAFIPVCRYWDRVSRPEQLMSAMLNAMRVLTDPENTGAVTVALPQDVQGEVYDYPEEFFKKRIYRIERTAPTKEMIKDASDLILKKKLPLIICGGGVKYSGAGDALLKFAEKFNIPIAETQAGKSAVLSSHPLNLGGIGSTGNLAANMIAKKADLIIGVGTRYTDFTTASKSLFQNSRVDFVNINIGKFDSYKMDGIKVTGDARVSLAELEGQLSGLKYKSSYKDQIRTAKHRWEKELKRLYELRYVPGKYEPEVEGCTESELEEFTDISGSCLTQTRAIGIINELLGKDDIIVGASGSLPGDLQRVWISKGTDTYHMEYGYSCMGYEVSAALGVKLASGNNKEVYAFTGDGSYMMLHSELITSVQEKQKINILLFDNMGFGCINNLQTGCGMGSYYTEFRYKDAKSRITDGDLIYTDFAMNAASYGCVSYTVKSEEELIAALIDSRKQKISTLIDIKVMPKTMTHGYESWWRVGIAGRSCSKRINTACEEMNMMLKKIKQY